MKACVVSLSKKLYPHYLVLVGSRNGFERDLPKQKLLFSQSKINKYKLMYDAFEMNINTHEDAFFCISLFFLLLFCDRKYPVN